MKYLSLSKGTKLHFLLRLRWWLAVAMGVFFGLLNLYSRSALLVFLNRGYLGILLKFGLFVPGTLGFFLNFVNNAALQSLDTAVQNERQHLARAIHDTVGQNLSYLHLKLDYLTTQEHLDPTINQELKRMQVVADEAYQQIRGTLNQLNSDETTDLEATLLEQAKLLGRRAGFAVAFATEGQATQLPLNTVLGIIYIFREALHNIEKHAQAQQVRLHIVWTVRSLGIYLEDNGRGFVPASVPPDGHFGIKIMQTRAQEMKARLRLASQPGKGTRMELYVPLH